MRPSLVFVLSFLAVSAAFAGEIPADAVSVWKEFKEAVHAKNRDKVATLSHFPILSNDLGGGNITSKAALQKKFDSIFQESFRKCISEKDLQAGQKNGEYVINCDGIFFGFRKYKSQYRFSYIENVNE